MKSARRIDWPGWAARAALAAGTAAIYGRTFAVPFLLDDKSSIAENGTIQRLWPIGPVLRPPADVGVGGRPLLNLSYALNHAFGGTAVFGYHLVNLLIHVLAAWVLFALVRRTLRSPAMAERFGAAATPLALAVSALWCWHPLQTEAVTYLSQRAESLMGLFYLLTVYCFIRSAEADGETEARRPPLRSGGRLASVSTGWAALCVLACLAGVATKEVIVTAPLMVLLYDRTFVTGSFAEAWRRHRWLYVSLAATWLPLACLMTGLNRRGVGFGHGLTAWDYGLIESRVVVKYLQLVFWPGPLVFDYGTWVPAHLGEVWPDLAVLVVLLGLTAWMLFGRPAERGGFRLRQGFGGQALGFAGAWIFLILAPTSSVVPVAGQPMAESRLYLPLAGIAAGVVLGAFWLAGRKSWPVLALAAAGLGLAAAQRNHVYSSEEAIWSDTIAKFPNNARAHNNLGNAWSAEPGKFGDAIAEFEEAICLNPSYVEAHNNLGNAWAKLPERQADAVAQLQEAVRLRPDLAEAHANLGSLWAKVPGRTDDAIAELSEAVRLKPELAEAHNNLGSVWAKVPGRLADAIAEYERALRLEPDYAEAHHNLGVVWAALPGRLPDAIAEDQQAVRLKPDYAQAHYDLGNLWMRLPGHLPEAMAEYQAALRCQPDYAEAHNNLGVVLEKLPGRLDEAIAEYEAALRLNPDYAKAHFNLGVAWARLPGRSDDAVAEMEKAVQLKPDDAVARQSLAAALRKFKNGAAPQPPSAAP